jgi:hypothetical protein
MSDERQKRDDGDSEDLQELLRSTSKEIKRAAKACRVRKGGLACELLELTGALVGALGPALAVRDAEDEDEPAPARAPPPPATPAGTQDSPTTGKEATSARR